MTVREYAAMDIYSPFIAHHGILGMHWGIRRTPAQLGHRTPVPRKLDKGKTGDYKNDGKTVKQTYGKGKTRLIQSRNEGRSVPKSNLQKAADTNEAKARRNKIIKRVAIAGIAAGATAGTIYALHKTGTLEAGKSKISALANSRLHGWDKDVITNATAKNDTERQLLKDAMSINKGGNVGRTMLANRDHNCGYCAFGFDLKQGGMNRQAKSGTSYEALSISDMMAKSYKNASNATVHDFGVCPDKNGLKRLTQRCREAGLTRGETNAFIKSKMREATEEYVKKDPLTRTNELVSKLKTDNGGNSRGILTVGWYTDKRASGSVICPHAINYVVKNGSTYFVDSQMGSVMRPEQFARTYGKRISGMTAYRTDNLTPLTSMIEAATQSKGGSVLSSLKSEHLSEYGKAVVKKAAIGTAIVSGSGASITIGKSMADKALASNDEKKDKTA